MKRRLTIISAMIIPGSGHVILKKPVRGLMLVFWMLAMGFITYNITEESISFIGRYSGGFLVYLLSILEVWKISK
jgi:hypothetical protein